MHSSILSLLALLLSISQGTFSHPASFAAESTSMGEAMQGQAEAKAMAMRSSGPASKNDLVPELEARAIGQRGFHGWAGVFSNENCTGDPIGPHPKVHNDDHCIKISPSVAPGPHTPLWIKIDWGIILSTLLIYHTEDCSDDPTVFPNLTDEDQTWAELNLGSAKLAVKNGDEVY